MTELAAGDEFAGYVIDRRLGAGGMGEVYLARHPRLPRHDALKVLAPQFTDDVHYRARFEREAELAAGLHHPAIVTVYDRGEADGRLWIAMAYVDGEDLAQRVRSDGPLAANQVSFVVSTVADALDRANARGLVHRDVKPANILLSTDGDVLLADFGIAHSQLVDTALTATGMAVGTIDFGSPEQLQGLAVDGRSDQYSLACTAYALLTGRAPFADSSAARVISNQLNAPLPSVLGRRPDVVPAVDGVLARATAKNPAHRFGTSSEFAAALASALAQIPAPTPPSPAYAPTSIGVPVQSGPPPGEPIPGPAPQRPPSAASTRSSKRRKRVLRTVLALIATIVVLGGGGIFYLWSTYDDGEYGEEPTDAARALNLDPATPVLPSLEHKPPDSGWRYQLPMTDPSQASPPPVNVIGATAETVLMGRAGGIDVVDSKTARRRATIDTRGGDRPPGLCAVGADDEWAVCQSADGLALLFIDLRVNRVLDGIPASMRGRAQFTITGDVLVVADGLTGGDGPQHRVQAFDRTGKRLWHHESETVVEIGGPVVNVVAKGEDGSASEQLRMIRVADGKTVLTVDDPDSDAKYQMFPFATGFVLADSIYDVDGRKLSDVGGNWKLPILDQGEPLVAPAPALPFFVNFWGELGAVDPKTGDMLWSRRINASASTQVVAVGGHIFVESLDGDAKDRRRYAWYDVATGAGGDVTLSAYGTVVGTDGTRLVMDVDRRLQVFGPDSDEPIWTDTGDTGDDARAGRGHLYLGGKRLV